MHVTGKDDEGGISDRTSRVWNIVFDQLTHWEGRSEELGEQLSSENQNPCEEAFEEIKHPSANQVVPPWSVVRGDRHLGSAWRRLPHFKSRD